MSSINDYTEQGEIVLKKSGLGGIDIISDPKGRGDLYLTDKRLVFIFRKRYNFPFINRMKNEALNIPLEDITNVKLYDRKLHVTVEDTYTFAFIGADKWVPEVKEAVASTVKVPQEVQIEQPSGKSKFCPYCGKPLSYVEEHQRYYCPSCERYIQ